MIRRISDRISFTLVLGLATLWLLLQQSLDPGQIVLAVALAVLLAWASSTFRSLRARLRRIDLAAVLVLVVIKEIVRSNFGVAKVVLGLVRDREVRSGFVQIPLELRDPHGLAALAAIVTATPGTVWAGLSPEGDTLTLHILDIEEEQVWVGYIKERFERPLMRIFE
jgi:multicomponent K+:H+ antiporter subunit E